MKMMLGRADLLPADDGKWIFPNALLPLKKIVELVASPPRNFRRVSFISEYYNAMRTVS